MDNLYWDGNDWNDWTRGFRQGNLPGFVVLTAMARRGPEEVYLVSPSARLNLPPELLERWARVVVGGEIGPEGAAIPPPYADLPFPAYVTTDKLHWLRAEHEGAAEKDKLRLATELLGRAEDAGDKIEAVRWRAVLAPQPNPAGTTVPN